MSVFLVAYDLNSPGQNYQGTKAEIEKFSHCKIQQSVYAVKTTLSMSELLEKLKAVEDKNDSIFISTLTMNPKNWTTFITKEKRECIEALFT